MYRTTRLAVAGIALAVLLPVVAEAQPKGINPAQPLPGVMGDNKQTVYYRPPGRTSGVGSGTMYVASSKVQRKAGEGLVASVTVTGQNRMVGVMIFDPKGKQLFADEEINLAAIRTATVAIDEVSAEGLYTIVVFSDAVGPYTLTIGNSAEDLSKKGLEAKVARLKKELADAEAALKALEEAEKKK